MKSRPDQGRAPRRAPRPDPDRRTPHLVLGTTRGRRGLGTYHIRDGRGRLVPTGLRAGRLRRADRLLQLYAGSSDRPRR